MITAAQAAARARRRGAVPHVVDGRTVRTRRAALAAIGAALSFPDWYGQNLDALDDCLGDLSWLSAGEHALIWSHHGVLAEADPDGYRAVLGVLQDHLGVLQDHLDDRLSVQLTER